MSLTYTGTLPTGQQVVVTIFGDTGEVAFRFDGRLGVPIALTVQS